MRHPDIIPNYKLDMRMPNVIYNSLFLKGNTKPIIYDVETSMWHVLITN